MWAAESIWTGLPGRFMGTKILSAFFLKMTLVKEISKEQQIQVMHDRDIS